MLCGELPDRARGRREQLIPRAISSARLMLTGEPTLDWLLLDIRGPAPVQSVLQSHYRGHPVCFRLITENQTVTQHIKSEILDILREDMIPTG